MAVYYAADPRLDSQFAIAGQSAFTLLVNGTGFTSATILRWNGNALPTSVSDSTDLVADVASTLIAAPGKATITVSDSSTTSNAVALAIASPAAATAGVVALVSAAGDGSPANGDSLVDPSISATGRFIAFQSNATNIATGTASSYQEIYERDTCIGAPSGCTPQTQRITVTLDGSPVNAHSRSSAISADGRYVAFDSSATNILPGPAFCNQFDCVYLRDTCIGAPSSCIPGTTRVALSLDGTPVGGEEPAITPDGRFVAFTSHGVLPGVSNVYVRDTCAASPTTCIPGTVLASQSASGEAGNQNSLPQVISSTGRFVAFQSYATNLLPGQTMLPGIFLTDTCLGVAVACTPGISRLDLAMDGSQPSVAAYGPAMSGDGRLVAFGSAATNLVNINLNGNCKTTSCSDVFVRDTCLGAPSGCTVGTSLVSLANDGSLGNCSSPGNVGGLTMSADGRFVAFGSIATNLSPDDIYPACGWEDIFVRDTCFGAAAGCSPSTVRVSVSNTVNAGLSANDSSVRSAISADGHYVVFISAATNFLPGVAGNGHAMVYLAKTGF